MFHDVLDYDMGALPHHEPDGGVPHLWAHLRANVANKSRALTLIGSASIYPPTLGIGLLLPNAHGLAGTDTDFTRGYYSPTHPRGEGVLHAYPQPATTPAAAPTATPAAPVDGKQRVETNAGRREGRGGHLHVATPPPAPPEKKERANKGARAGQDRTQSVGVDATGRAWTEAAGEGNVTAEAADVLLRHFDSSEGLVIHMLLPDQCTERPKVLSSYHESASFFRHDLPVGTAFDRDHYQMRAACVGLIVSPQTGGRAWPVDANIGTPPCEGKRTQVGVRTTCRPCASEPNVTEHVRSQLARYERACQAQKPLAAWGLGDNSPVCSTKKWEWAFAVQQALHASSFCRGHRKWIWEQFISRHNEVEVRFTPADVQAVVYLEQRRPTPARRSKGRTREGHTRRESGPGDDDDARVTRANCLQALRLREAVQVHPSRRAVPSEARSLTVEPEGSMAEGGSLKTVPLLKLRNGLGASWRRMKALGPLLQPAECES